MMAKYSDIDLFRRDFWPTAANETYPRIVDRAAEIAYDYINSRLSRRYTVPFSGPPYPSTIVSISDLLTKCVAASMQAKRSPQLSKGDGKRSGGTDDCSMALDWLNDLASGEQIIPGVATLVSDGYHTRAGYTPIFDVDSAVNHQPDPDLIDKIIDERGP